MVIFVKKGLVHIYTGDGKGKTSAASGLAVRCAGCGKKVVFRRFLKGGESSELASFLKLGINVKNVSTSRKFYFQMNDSEKELANSEILNSLDGIFDEKCDLLVLDEIICAVSLGIIEKERIVRLISEKPPETELVLTGRDAPEYLYEYADYVSKIVCVKHPYSENVPAREGIEF